MVVAKLVKLSKNVFLNPSGLIIHQVKVSSFDNLIGSLEVSYSNDHTSNYKQNLFIIDKDEKEEFIAWLEGVIKTSTGPLSDSNITMWMKK